MKITAIIKRDIKTNTRSKIKLLSLIVAMLIPLAYGFLYLWAFWNPYDNMKNVPVAVVNEDKGALYEGEMQNIGEKITDELEKNKVLNWTFTDRQEAENGLDRQKYYAVILIPENFSSNLVSAGSDAPQRAVISWETRDSTNFLFTAYFKNVIAALGKTINVSILPKFSIAAEAKIEEATGKLTQASEGAAALGEGIAALHEGSATMEENLKKAETGSGKLADGLGTLDSKSEELTSGVTEIANGASSLSAGLTSANEGAASLNDGMQKLSEGAGTLKEGSEKMKDGTTALAEGMKELDSKLDAADEKISPFYPILERISDIIVKINDKTPLTLPDYISEAAEQKNALFSGVDQLSEGSDTVAEKMSDLDKGIGTLQSGIDTASSGADSLSDGLATLDEGGKKLSEGTKQAAEGVSQYTAGVNSAYTASQTLNAGIGQLADGSGKLTKGLASAEQGANLLSSSLEAGEKEIKNKLSPDKINTLLSVINEPIGFENISQDTNETYGSGFAPYFIPLSLWMGALILSLLVPARDPKLIISGVSRPAATLGKFFLPAAVGVVQAILLSLAIICGLGLNPRYPLLFILFCIFISLVFNAIMQLLSFAFGKIGELFGILLLMIQLTSASGTFPVESAPRFFQAANPLIPMTYAIRGLRLLILGGNMTIAKEQAGILAIFLFSALALKALASKKTIRATDIYPLIEL
jgi:putative membrane protein